MQEAQRKKRTAFLHEYVDYPPSFHQVRTFGSYGWCMKLNRPKRRTVLKAPTHCGVWGRKFLGSLFLFAKKLITRTSRTQVEKLYHCARPALPRTYTSELT
jgi:hypothetical protein